MIFERAQAQARQAIAISQAMAVRQTPLASSRLPSVRIEVFRSFAEAEATWRQAQEHCACYGFQTFEWLSTWQETIGAAQKIEPHIVHIAAASGATLMLLPLGIQRRLGLSSLSFLGGAVTDYHAPVVRAEFAESLDAASCSHLIEQVLERLPRVDTITFERMPSRIDGVANPLTSLPNARRTYNAHAATLGDCFSSFKQRRSSKFFGTAARKWRRLSQIAPVKFCIAESPDAAAEILSALVRQKRRFYREAGAADQFSKPGYLSFYSTLAKRHLDSGLIQMSALRAGETLLATHWGMVFRDRLYWLMPSYEAGDWARFSPGRLLMQSLVEWSISQGLKTFDLTLGDESYKSLWADHTLELYGWTCGLTLRGKAYGLTKTGAGQIRKRAKQTRWLPLLVKAWRRHMAFPAGT